MKKIGITGSLASGKTTASQILTGRKFPLFSADKIVNSLYSKKNIKSILFNKFKITKNSNLKKNIRKRILENKRNIKKLEKIIHPIVRKEMYKFLIKNKEKRLVFLEIPLLIESKLMKNFDTIIFIKAKKSIRLKRFIKKGGDKRIFNTLNDKQLSDVKKAKFSDIIVVNDGNFKIFKKNLLDIIKNL